MKLMVKISEDDLVVAASNVKGSKKYAIKLFAALKVIHDARISSTVPKRVPAKAKLKDVLNPKSKYYDDTSKLTSQLSLIWFNHHQALKRYRHKRIRRDDRQWALLVAVKRELLSLDGVTENNLLVWGSMVFREAEHLAEKIGKASPYLSMILARFDEVVDNIDASMSLSLTKKHKRIYRLYCVKRAKAIGKPYTKKLVQGSDTHRLIARVSRIIRRHDVTIQKFMVAQFDAFAHHGSFPRIKDLVTDAADDRVEQSLAIDRKVEKQRSKNNDPDVKKSKHDSDYWKEVERAAEKKN